MYPVAPCALAATACAVCRTHFAATLASPAGGEGGGFLRSRANNVREGVDRWCGMVFNEDMPTTALTPAAKRDLLALANGEEPGNGRGITYGPWSQLRDAGLIDGNTQWDYSINDHGRRVAADL